METTKDNADLIHLAIHQLIEEKKNREISSASGETFVADDEDQLLLSRLLSQLESLKGDGTVKQPEPSSAESPSPAVGEAEKSDEGADEVDGGSIKVGTEDIVKELRKVKRQNSITHRLLSILIVLTVAWQLSEVSLILKLKNGLSQPFRSFTDLLTGMLKGPRMIMDGHDAGKQASSTKQHQIEAPSFPPLKIPELPQMDLSNLCLSGKD